VTEPLLDHLSEVAGEIGSDSHLLLGLDFDGTLAPIVTDPAQARMPEETRAALQGLVLQPRTTVAIISGRACEDLRSRVQLDVIVAGNHGLEIVAGNTRWHHPIALNWQPAVHEMCGDLSRLTAEIEGVLVEDKGPTASLHYRNVAPADTPRLLEILNAVVASHSDHFFVRSGKKVFEILPRVQWDKGSAVLMILEWLRATEGPEVVVCYIGDDSTDECAFQKLTGAVTVRVGKSGSTAARFRADGTAEVYEFLNWLFQRSCVCNSNIQNSGI
jgi:trehalose 6-phosphate phosphatase